VLVSGGSFAVVQFWWSNYVGPELVDIVGGLVSLVALAVFCAFWKPAQEWDFPESVRATDRPLDAEAAGAAVTGGARSHGQGEIIRAWMPWVFLSVFVALWGLAPVKALLNSGPSGFASYQATGRVPPANPVLSPAVDVPMLHRMVYRDFPVEPEPADRALLSDPTYKARRAEAARFVINWLSATGTGILFASILTALYLRIGFGQLMEIAAYTVHRMRWPLVTISAMLALGFVTRYGGTDATLGLAFTKTGWFYPFFGTLLGWLGVALTGSDTSSNVLFGSLQKITAQQLGLDPVLITTANSTGGVMGKMVDAQSIVVATAATGQHGHEGRILRFVFWHSIALAAIMGIIVMLQAYVFPWMIPKA
jgi:lactate permease